MYQSALLTNVNAKRINQPTNTSRATEAYKEPEFSYNDVLYDEMSRNVKRHKRNTSNNSRNGSSANAATTLNTSSKISMFSNPMTNFSLGGIQSSSYMTSLGAANTSSNNTTKDDILNWVKKLIDKKNAVNGDANGDGKVDLNDLKVMVDRMFDDKIDINMKNVDFDGDGKISLDDLEKVIDIIVNQDKENNESNPPIKEILKGDVNGDGKITQEDAKLISKYYVGDNVEIDMNNADIDDNGKITLADVSQVKQLANKFDPQILKGDANGDGKVNYRDVQAIDLAQINLGGKIDRIAADIDDDGDITGVDVSKAKKLANEYENRFQTIRGDSNGDGTVDERDYTNVKGFINNINSSDDFVMKNSDINGDGQVDEEDLKRLRDIIDGFRVNYNSTTNLGDIDGDGFLSISDAVYLRNYINRSGNTNKEFFINNADINKDGKIDMSDVTAIQDILKNVKTAEREVPVFRNVGLSQSTSDVIHKADNFFVLEQQGSSYKVQYTYQNTYKIGWVDKSIFDPIYQPDPIPYPYEGKYDGNAMWTYTDENLTHHNGNDVVTSGQIVTVLGETNNSWHIRYTNVKGEAIERYLSKNPPASYQPWTAKALTYKEAYGNDGKRTGNEAVYANDVITVLNESNNAYQVEYPTSNGKTKIRWISKTDVVPYEKQDNPNPPLQDMKTSDSAIEMIKHFEAYDIDKYLTAYQNKGEKYLTIGYGHYGPDVKEGMTITVAQAEAYLRQDLLNAENAVKKYCAHLNLNQHQFDALVSFTFNLDVKNLLRLLYGENGDEVRPLEELPEHMVWYRKDGTGSVSQGLINRRNAEVALFNTPV